MNATVRNALANMKNRRLKPFLFLAIAVLAGTAAVIILRSPAFAPTDLDIPDCRGEPACWRTAMEDALRERGLDQALELVAKLYRDEPEFAQSCHSFLHELGEAAYSMFSRNEALHLTPKTSYCGYGFFHGFMEALLFSGGTMEEARAFCAEADRQLSSEARDARGACLHGIGHGVVDGSDPRLWGDAQKFVSPGLALCEKVGADAVQIDRCASGSFNSLAIAFNSSQYGLTANANDPYWVCKLQTKHYFKKPCFEEMNTTVFLLSDKDLRKAAAFVAAIPEDIYAGSAISSVAGYAASFYRDEQIFPEIVEICQSAGERLRFDCIEGFAGGLAEFGEPEKEHERATAFCSSPSFSTFETRICFARIIGYFKQTSSPDKLRRICDSFAEEYRTFCNP